MTLASMINWRQNREYNGYWWLPTDSDSRLSLSGILRYKPGDGFELEVIGSFFDLPELHSKLANPKIIHGTSSDGTDITLYLCVRSNILIGSRSIGPHGVQTSRFRPKFVFIGAHFEKEPVFKNIIVNYSYLDEWVNINGFDIPMPSSTEEFSIKYKRPEDIIINLDENFDLKISYSIEGPNWRMVQTEASIKQRTYIVIESKNEASLTRYDDIIVKIRNFLSFGVGEPVSPLTIIGQSEEYVSSYKDKKFYDNIEIFYNRINVNNEYKTLIPPDMFFTFEDISRSFEKYIKNWFIRAELLSPVFDLYFSNVYTAKMYDKTRFLNAAQAIESYHRRRDTTKKFEVDPKEHEERMIEIICFAPIEYKDWLLAKLKYSNEVSLSQRLKEILTYNEEIAEIYIGDKREQKKFMRSVVDTRNFLTHFDKEIEAKSAKGVDLLILIEKIKILIKTCLLKEIGMNDSEIAAILRRRKDKSFISWDVVSWD
jgi:hypothetical protein